MFVHPHQQQRPVTPPISVDKLLTEFAGKIQNNLLDLWTISHDHTISATDRAAYAALTTDAERVAFLASFLGL